jgi:predicted TIM-barrel fold metal-dependent hydrolase
MTATNDDWLAQVREEALEPELPICDTHHHLWGHRPQRTQQRYLMDDIQRDLRSGHNIVSTVFVECHSMYRADGPEEMKPVGEVEFVNGSRRRRPGSMADGSPPHRRYAKLQGRAGEGRAGR